MDAAAEFIQIRTVFNPTRIIMQTLPRSDTKAWKFQVWASFGIALSLAGTGLAWLPGHDLDRAFMFMGYIEARLTDTPLWGTVVWAAFVFAMGLTAWGLWRMDINPAFKSFLGVSWLYLVSAAFTLAKMLRDEHECAKATIEQ